MLKAIIVDDEPNGRSVLGHLLNLYCTDITILASCESAEEARKAIKEHQPDLVFLDIEMPNEDGFQLLSSLSEINFHIIFVTAHNHHAIKAIKFNALDYVLKPINVEELISTIRRIKEIGPKKENNNTLVRYLVTNFNSQNEFKKLSIPTKDGYIFVEITELIRCESDSNYTIFFMTDKSKIISSRTLKEFDEILIDHQFLRVHKSHLVNIHHIKGYIKGEGGFLLLSDNSKIEVSRRRKEELLAKLLLK
jgi:two-component system LytT family response regulator